MTLSSLLATASGCSGGDERLDPAWISPGTSVAPGEAAPCDDGATRTCYVTLGVHEAASGGQVLTCFEGTQACADRIWGPCEDGTQYEIPAPDSTAGEPDTTNAQAYSTPTNCLDNPCDPFCQTYVEEPPLPLEADPDPTNWTFTWPMGSIEMFDGQAGGLVDKGMNEPCVGAWDCQFNYRCVAPGLGTCTHDMCTTGAALTDGCNLCVTGICDVDPTCCGAPVIPPPCRADEDLGPDGVSCFYFENTTTATQPNARAACQARGAGWDLAAIENAVENAFINSAITGRGWIGLTDATTEGTFVWLDGSTSTYRNWNTGEPNNSGNEDCVHYWDDTGVWNDQSCADSLRYVCRGPSRSGGSTCAHDPCQRGAPLKSSCNSCVGQICAAEPSCCTTAWTASCANRVSTTCGNSCECPAGEFSFEGSCYWPTTRAEKGSDAVATCTAHGANWNVATVGSSGENAFIQTNLASTADVWIGLNDVAIEGNYVWRDGSADAYRRWNWGEPDGGIDDCVRLQSSDGDWNDTSCGSKYTVACEGPGGTMVVSAANGGATPGTWDQSCIDMVQTVCRAYCDEANPGNTNGNCLPWYPTDVDESCLGVDLSLAVPCGDGDNLEDQYIPICNHGTQDAVVDPNDSSTWIPLTYFSADSVQYPDCNTQPTATCCVATGGNELDKLERADDCYVKQTIPSGECIAYVLADDCPGLYDAQNMTIMINPPWDAGLAPECSCLDNWTLFRKTALAECGPPICSGGSLSATPIRQPVDVVVIIDNSGSMSGEINAVQDRINDDLAAILAASGIDYRVIMISRYGDVDVAVGDSNHPICVGTPLGANACTNAGGGEALVLNPPQYYHYSADIESLDAWCQLLGGFSSADELGESRSGWTVQAPNGWGAWLRPEAYKAFLVITDDDVSCSKHGYSFNDSNTAAGGTAAAAAFDAALLSLSPTQFGTAANRNYTWHSIIGMAYNSPATDPWPPTAAVQTTRCDNAATSGGDSDGPGTGYQALSILTGGLRFPICSNDDFDAIFNAIATDVIRNADMLCEVPLNATGLSDPSNAIVNWEHPDATSTALTQVRDEASCTAGAFYYDDLFAPTSLTLCPATCDAIEAEFGSQLFVELPCIQAAQETSFFEEYEATCATGAPQWSFFSWNTMIPDDGARIQFSVRTATTQAGLATATWVDDVAIATNATQVCPLSDATCVADVYEALETNELLSARFPFLELRMTLVPGTTFESPVVLDWEITYSCPPDE